MSAGMAYEAMNNAGARRSRLIVVLNDNDMSIAPPVGAMSAYLSRLMSSHSFLSLRELGGRMAKRFPRGIERTARRAEEYARGMLTGGTLFEELGFYYVGPIDGHNLDHLLPVLRNVREAEEIVAEFARVNPARRAARRLLGIGPLVGACWAAALVTDRASAWPVPFTARILIGLALITIIGLLAASALSTRYRLAARAGVAGFVGIAALDAVLITGVTFTSAPMTWVMVGAMLASTARIAFAARSLVPALAR
jgi:hypothetical protein